MRALWTAEAMGTVALRAARICFVGASNSGLTRTKWRSQGQRSWEMSSGLQDLHETAKLLAVRPKVVVQTYLSNCSCGDTIEGAGQQWEVGYMGHQRPHADTQEAQVH